MSEAIILYRGRGGVDPESLKPQTVTSNGMYTAPVTGNYWVAVVGGGGGGGGGCRNSWNSSQVFYGAGGSRGTLGSKTVFLNAGDQVSISLGAGGSGGTNNTTVVSNNSRGSNGGAGATSSFGSYQSGSGGTWGGYSWSRHYWSNTYNWNNGYTIESALEQGYWYNAVVTTTRKMWYSEYIGYSLGNNDFYGMAIYGTIWLNGVRNSCVWQNSVYNKDFSGDFSYWGITGPGTYNVKMNNPIGLYLWNNKSIPYNKIEWNNRIVNTTTRCYTSIQQGSWWYTNAANNVSTSGTRTYRGDGGASGSAGNAGFIVIVPPSL